jgi:hypothetical protein
MNPKEIKIVSKTWWVKPIEMLVHNWALIEEDSKYKFTVYFFMIVALPKVEVHRLILTDI